MSCRVRQQTLCDVRLSLRLLTVENRCIRERAPLVHSTFTCSSSLFLATSVRYTILVSRFGPIQNTPSPIDDAERSLATLGRAAWRGGVACAETCRVCAPYRQYIIRAASPGVWPVLSTYSRRLAFYYGTSMSCHMCADACAWNLYPHTCACTGDGKSEQGEALASHLKCARACNRADALVRLVLLVLYAQGGDLEPACAGMATLKVTKRESELPCAAARPEQDCATQDRELIFWDPSNMPFDLFGDRVIRA